MKTYFQTAEEGLKARKWLLVDAKDKTVGRLASEVAMLIRGKNKPTYTPQTDGGDFVVVVNAEKVVFTGKKKQAKLYRHHTGFMGGLKEVPAEKVLEKNPEYVITEAVSGMLPKGPLGRAMATKLKVYRGEKHPHAAQSPEVYNLKYS